MSEVITYPPSIESDQERLCAVYSLLEQMRLEHNRQGEIARSNWSKYKDRWAEYARLFKAKQLPLLQEQNRLRDNIRKEHYSDAAWRAIPARDKDEVLLQLFGDKESLKVRGTQAECNLLNELKSVNFDGLGAFEGEDPLEDFTTYDYSDPNSDLTITASKITVDAMRNDVEAYVRDGHAISGDFEHLLHHSITSLGLAAGFLFWGISNGYNSREEMEAASEGIALYSYSYNGVAKSVYIIDFTNYNYDSNFNSCAAAYDKVFRSGTTAGCYMYSDAERASLIDTITITCGTDSYSHIFGLASFETNDNPSSVSSGYAENLDLQEAGVTEKSSSDSGSGADTKTSGDPIATLSKSEAGSGADAKADYPTATFSKSESGSGVEQSLLSLLLSSSESGSGAEAVVYLLSELLKGDGGSGVEDISGRDLVSPDSGAGTDSLLDLLTTILGSETGSGVEQSSLLMIVDKFSSETGSGVEAAALIMALFSGDEGAGSELGMLLMKTILGSDGGSGCDTLKLLVGTGGSDVRLPDRQGQVRIPSKGVNL